VGVATIDERLRAKFKGKPENVVNFFNAVAEEVREIMARLGFRTIDEMVGRTQCLRQKQIPGHPKANTLNLSRMITDVVKDDPTAIRYATRDRNDPEHDQPLDDIILQDAEESIRDAKPVKLSYKVDNTNRSLATKVSGEVAFQYGEEGLPEGTLELNFTGTAGQSFGAFLAPGIRLILTGEGNDYVGKSMSGGEIVIRPLPDHRFVPEKNSIIGNTVMYGATAGILFANGRAGERFCVRNSGGTAVVEGIGDHGCEYMTGGVVVVLGATGRNFAAGMSGGIAYVYDPEGRFAVLCNPAMVDVSPVSVARDDDEGTGRPQQRGIDVSDYGMGDMLRHDAERLRVLIERHHLHTASKRARMILDNWAEELPRFVKVMPRDYARALRQIEAERREAASIAAE
jgi:glutamate synthase (NADPH/NADH) large chain